MQELKYLSIIKNENCYIKEYLIDNNELLEIIKCYDNNKLLYLRRKIPVECYFYNSNIDEVIKADKQSASQFLLQAHIQYFTKNGMNPDELIFILENHPYYKNIEYEKNLLIIDGESIKNIKKPQNRDFQMFPILENNHWLTGIIQFDEQGNQTSYYTFDSDMKRYEQSHKDIGASQNRNTQILNDRNLQGNSNLCWLFTLEFMKEANKYNNFEELKRNLHPLSQNVNKSTDLLQKKIEEIQYLQQKIYINVNQTLQKNNVSIDLNKISDGRVRSKLVGGNGYGKLTNLSKLDAQQTQQISRSLSCPILKALSKCSVSSTNNLSNTSSTQNKSAPRSSLISSRE